VKEVIREYLRTKEELKLIRSKFHQTLKRKQDKDARTYALIMKDYRSAQVKLLQTLVHLGVKNSEDDLAKLLSDLPEVKCDVQDCACAYHLSIKRIIDRVKRDDYSKDPC